MAGLQAASGQASVNSAFTWSLLLYNGYQFCSSNVWVLQHNSVHTLDMSTIIVFCVFGVPVQMKSASCHTSCIHKGVACWEMTWPNDLQTRFCQYTGISLDRLHWNHTGWWYRPVVFQWQSREEPHVHWDATGTTLTDANTQWCSSGNPMLICIIGTH